MKRLCLLSGMATFFTLTHSVKEEGENIVVTLEVPGIEAQNMEIDAAENYITVRGSREKNGVETKKTIASWKALRILPHHNTLPKSPPCL